MHKYTYLLACLRSAATPLAGPPTGGRLAGSLVSEHAWVPPRNAAQVAQCLLQAGGRRGPQNQMPLLLRKNGRRALKEGDNSEKMESCEKLFSSLRVAESRPVLASSFAWLAGSIKHSVSRVGIFKVWHTIPREPWCCTHSTCMCMRGVSSHRWRTVSAGSSLPSTFALGCPVAAYSRDGRTTPPNTSSHAPQRPSSFEALPVLGSPCGQKSRTPCVNPTAGLVLQQSLDLPDLW